MASPHQITYFPFFHVDLHCRRIKSGYHYQVAILADDTWRCLHDTLSTTPLQQNESLATTPDGSKTNFYTKIYDGLVRDESMRTDVDRKLALAVREACQSHCSRAEREKLWQSLLISLIFASISRPARCIVDCAANGPSLSSSERRRNYLVWR